MRALFCLVLLAVQLVCSSFISIHTEGLDVDVGMGYRRDSFKWNIAGPNGHPNVLSELSWRDMESFLIQANVRKTFCNHVYLRGMADYGKIQNGEVTDSDYLADHRRMEFLRSVADAEHGSVYDYSIGLGYLLEFGAGCFNIAPIIGVSHHEQHLRMHDGDLVFNLFDPTDVGEIHHLHSWYKARWSGPWVGVDVVGHLTPCFVLFGTLEYHAAKYKGRGHWNLRREFLDDFKHKANGHGMVSNVGVAYDSHNRWYMSLITGYQAWSTGSGTDKLHVMTEEFGPLHITTRLNKVCWHAFSLVGTWGYRF